MALPCLLRVYSKAVLKIIVFWKNLKAAFPIDIMYSFYMNVRQPQVTIKKATANYALMLVFSLLNVTDVILKFSPESLLD